MQNFIITLGTMSFQACIIIAIVLVLRKLFEKLHISKKYMMILWILPFFCLLCPWKVSIPHGFWQTTDTEIVIRDMLQEEAEELAKNRVENSTITLSKTDAYNVGIDKLSELEQLSTIQVLGTVWAMGIFLLFIYNLEILLYLLYCDQYSVTSVMSYSL